jgi:hypothetical protein
MTKSQNKKPGRKALPGLVYNRDKDYRLDQ